MTKQLTKWDEQFAAMAAEYAGAEKSGGSFISTQAGVLSFEGDPLPGNQMLTVILDVVRERTFYTDRYDASREHNAPPVCYAFARMDEPEEAMAPHPSMQADLDYFQPQNDICKTCPHNEWGTSDTGRGKACSERRRLALLPAGYFMPKRGSRDLEAHVFDTEEHYRTADIAFLKLPVMSVKHYGRYVAQLASQHRRPPLGVITRIYIEPDPKAQFTVRYEMMDLLPPELYEVIMARHQEAKDSIIFGYTPPSGEQEQPRGKARR